MTDLLIAPCNYEAAKFAVEYWHYSHTMPAPKHFTLGVWEEQKYVGAVIFSRGGNNNIGKPYGLCLNEICELTRIALGTHKTPVSKILSIALKMLKKQNPGLRLVVSYADKNEGHHGGIYQATNWIYVGQTTNDFYLIDQYGKKHHSRAVSETGVKRQFGQLKLVPKPSQNKIVWLDGKYKYLFALDDAMRKQILPLAKLYPKRAVEVNGDTAIDQIDEGGSSPTQPLIETSNGL